MASTTSAYTYQKPSTIATRSLVTGTKPTEAVSSSSHDADTHDRPTLQRNTTDHYQQAMTAVSLNNTEAAPAIDVASTGKPALDRQQSWKHSDMKRGVMEKMLGDRSGAHGYSTTSS